MKRSLMLTNDNSSINGLNQLSSVQTTAPAALNSVAPTVLAQVAVIYKSAESFRVAVPLTGAAENTRAQSSAAPPTRPGPRRLAPRGTAAMR